MVRYPIRLTAVAAVTFVLALTMPVGLASASALTHSTKGQARSLDVAVSHSRPHVAEAAQSGGAIVPGFSSMTFGPNDDGSYPCTGPDPGVPPGCTPTPVTLPFPVKFYGNTYSSVYLNNNGNLTFGQPLSEFTPESLNQLNVPMIAPFWSDVDTRTGPVVTFGYGTVGGHMAFGANWLGVGCFDETDSVAAYFQVLLISRADVGYGDFDIEFNYGPLAWDSGQASGGDAQCLGGTAARAGYTSGFGASYELPGSGVDGGLLSSNSLTGLSLHSMNSTVLGRYVFPVRGLGHPKPQAYVALGDSYSSGEGTGVFYNKTGGCDQSYLAWPYTLSLNYPAAPFVQQSSFFACSGNTTAQVLNTQVKTELTPWVSSNGSPGLVTVTVGGDDSAIGFKPLLTDCVWWGGQYCVHLIHDKMAYLKNGSFEQTLYGAFKAIKAATQGTAEVVAVGYPFIFPSGKDQSENFYADVNHCVWLDGDAGEMFTAFRQGQLLVDQVMQQAASQAGILFVPLDGALAGHELCTGTPYVNALVPFSSNAGHPDFTGQNLMAQAVAQQLGLLSGYGGANAGRAARHTKAQDAKIKARPTHLRARSSARSPLPAPPTRPSPKASRHLRAASALSISSAIPDGLVAAPYAGYLWTSGGTGPYSWSVTSGSLPAGLSLDPSSGIISGTPTGTGTSTFTVTATDSSSPAQTANANLSITTDPTPPVSVQTSALADATVGQQYLGTVSATGGFAPYTWSVSSGSLPAGLRLIPSSGTITGTPTAAGTRTFTVTASDSSTGNPLTGSKTYTVNVVPAASALALSAPQLPDGTQGTGYTGMLTATGGTAPVYWSVASGALPDGLSLDPGTGDISGIPTASGTFSFTAQVQDASSPTPQSVAETESITIAAASAPAISTTAIPDGAVGSPYEQTIDASGGVAPYTWSVTSGTLPDGLTLDPDSGTIRGTPTTAGTYSFDVSLADSAAPNAQVATASLSLNIATAPPPPAMAVTDTVTDATTGASYNASVIPVGGTGPYAYAVTSGALPPGLSLDGQEGTITGTPTTAGTYSAAIQVTDSSSPTLQTATDTASITVQSPGPLTVTTSSLPDASAGTTYAQPIAVTGGVGADSFAVTGGALPDGLTLDPGTGIIAGTPTSTGPAAFTVTVTDSATPTPDTTAVSLTLTTDAEPALTIPASTLPDAVQGSFYSQAVAATGGVAPYIWSVSSGSLPTGLSLDPSTGIISGTPTGSGSSTFTIEVTDSSSPTAQTATETLSLNVDPVSPLNITTSGLDPAMQGTAYSFTLNADGGTSPVTWSVTNGSLPAGLTLDANAGVISGTPTGWGTSYFTVQATDSSTPTPQTATADMSLEVAPQPGNVLTPQSISFTPPTSGTVGGSATLSATGGGSGNPVIFSVDASSGTGICNVSGTNGTTVNYTAPGICVIDANQAGNASYAAAAQVQGSIPVQQASQSISFTPPTSGTVGGSATLSATGGGSGNPVVFSVDASSGAGVCNVSGTNGTTANYTAAGSCVIDANQAGNANYSPAPQVQGTISVKATSTALSVTKSGTGAATGTVTSSPSGINCGTICSASYASGSTVTLTAIPAAGEVFTGWSGTPSCIGMASHTCTLTLSSNTTVNASFTASATLHQETSATYTGSWLASKCTCYSGGTDKKTSASGASATFKFTGNLIQFVSEKGSTRGSFKVYLDGVYQATASTYITTPNQNAVIVWQKSFSTVGTHKLKIVNLATSGHPRIDVDAFVVAT